MKDTKFIPFNAFYLEFYLFDIDTVIPFFAL